MHAARDRSARIPFAVAVVLALAIAAAVMLRRDGGVAARDAVVRDGASAMATAAARERPSRAVAADAAPEPSPVATPSPTPSGDIRVFGRVVDEADGGPIAGATILSFPAGLAERSLVPAAFATTATDGRFEGFTDRRGARGLFVAQVDGYERRAGNFSFEFLNDPDPREREVLFTLAAGGGAIGGTVVDESAAPVAGVVVGGPWMRRAKADRGDNRAWCAVATTDAAGRFVLDGLPPGESFVLPVRAEGYLRAESAEVAVGGETTIVLRRSEASVAGTLTTHDGRPVSDVPVSIASTDRSPRTHAESLALASRVLTDAQGAFAFPDMPAGPFVVRAGYDSSVCRPDDPLCAEFDLAVGDARQLAFRLPAPVVVEGRVYDVATNKGVAGAVLSDHGIERLRQHELSRKPSTTARSAADGAYRLPVLSYGSIDIRYELPPGWAADSAPYGSSQLSVAFSADGKPAPTDLPVTRAATLHGVVVRGERETPVPSVPVFLSSPDGVNGKRRFSSSDATGSDGTFSIVVPRGRAFALHVRTDGAAAEGEAVVPEEGEPAFVKIVLVEHAVVLGRITANGAPVAGLRVAVLVKDGFGSHENAETDADGRYEIADIRPGAVQIDVSSNAVPRANVILPEPKAIDLAPGERAVVDFDLEWGTVFEGVVTDEEGAPVERANVSLSLMDSGHFAGHFAATTDSEGYYSIGGLGGTETFGDVTVHAKGYFTASQLARSVEDSPVNVVLRANPGIPLLVCAGSPATPVARFRCTVFPHRGSPIARIVDAPDGRTTLTDIPEGTHRLEVCEVAPPPARPSNGAAIDGFGGDPFGAPGGDPFAGSSGFGDPFPGGGFGDPFAPAPISTGRCGAIDFDVRPGIAPTPLVVDVGAGVPVAGRVVTGAGEPVAGVNVCLLAPGAHLGPPAAMYATEYRATTDASGAFAFAAVAPASYTAAAWENAARNGDGLLGSVDTVVPSPHPIEIVVASAGSIDVFVLAEGASEYATDAGIAYEIASQGRGNASLPAMQGTLAFGAGARARIDGVPFGHSTIAVTMPDGRVGLQSFTLVPAEPLQSVVVDVRATVMMTGTVRIDGSPWTGMPPLALGGGVDLEPLGEGRYVASVSPGSFCLAASGPLSVVIEEVRVPGGVPTFERHFDLQLNDASVVLVVPEGEIVLAGEVDIALRDARGRPCFPRARSTLGRDATALFEGIPTGEYVARFTSANGKWIGSSEPTPVGPGRGNVLVVRIRLAVDAVPIGVWDTSTMVPGMNTMTFDAGLALADPGRWTTLVFECTGGDGSVEFVRARLATMSGTADRTFSAFVAPDAGDVVPSGPLGNDLPDASRGCIIQLDAIPHGPGTSTGVVWLRVEQ